MSDIAPVCTHFSEGEVFDFGTHANDFLLKRENALATETFLVRVPGRGSVPAHTHTDMEQTFVFIAGVGTATLSRGEDRRTFECDPGTVVFVPTGWEHSVIADSPEGVRYITVNAFVPGVERVGQTATGHAEEVADAFPEPTLRGALSRLEIFRTAENTYHRHADQWWATDFDSLQATARRHPGHYRVLRLGPFEVARSVSPVPAEFTADHADAIFEAVGADLKVFVEGSQSPLSVKPPCRDSDLDLLIAISKTDDLPAAQRSQKAIAEVCETMSVPVSVGIVCEAWLRLPSFYSALSTDPSSEDRRWWSAPESDRLAEADSRLRRGLELLGDSAAVQAIFSKTLELTGVTSDEVLEWRIGPRWRGMSAPEGPDEVR